MSPCYVCPTPVELTVRARYDHAAVRGTVCIFVEGGESHQSCWLSEEEDRPLVVRRFRLETAGEYAVEMRSESHATPVAQVVLQ